MMASRKKEIFSHIAKVDKSNVGCVWINIDATYRPVIKGDYKEGDKVITVVYEYKDNNWQEKKRTEKRC